MEQIERETEERGEAIRQAYATGDYTLAEIGAHFDLHYSMISRIVRGELCSQKNQKIERDAK